MSTPTLPQAVPGTESEALTPEEREYRWYRDVYRGDSMPQLTVRSVVMGSVLGAVMSLSNLYVGLKTGWGLGVAITACILSYAIWTSLSRIGVVKGEMSILENNAMQSTASSAGYSTGGTMVSAIAAYLMVTGHHMPFWTLVAWTFFLAMLGVMMAIPMKRQMINREQLRFPSGVAAATTLQSLHAKGAEAVLQARSLFLAMGVGAAIASLKDGMAWANAHFKASWPAIPTEFHYPEVFKIAGQPLAKWTFTFENSSIMIAAGALMGWRTGWSMLLGAVLTYGVVGPYVWQHFPGAIPEPEAVRKWTLWGGSALMVSSGLVGFGLQWKTILRALRPTKGPDAFGDDPLQAIEVPNSWFWAGTAIASLGVMAVMHFAFQVGPVMSLIAVALTFFLALVACRATGETDTTPIGAMGKITQLTYGVLAPANTVANLMTACITAGAAGSAADLLTDLKSGYLLGANPRKQFLAQFAGIFVGTAVVVPAFYLLVPDASVLGSDKYPAPAAMVWASVAKLLGNGLDSLHPTAQAAILIGGLVGAALPLLEAALPQKARAFVPSSMGLGLSMVIPGTNAISMFLGACIARIWEKRHTLSATRYLIPVSSGLIAGESLVGVAVALLGALWP